MNQARKPAGKRMHIQHDQHPLLRRLSIFWLFLYLIQELACDRLVLLCVFQGSFNE